MFNFVFTDIGETHVVEIGNSVLNHRQSEPVDDADATVRMTRDFWLDLITGKAGLQEMVFSNEFEIEGSRLSVIAFLGSLQNPRGRFQYRDPIRGTLCWALKGVCVGGARFSSRRRSF